MQLVIASSTQVDCTQRVATPALLKACLSPLVVGVSRAVGWAQVPTPPARNRAVKLLAHK